MSTPKPSLVQELEYERDKIASMRNSFPIDAASWRGVDEHDVCAECGGAGTKIYGNTSTYHYSAGGQAMTLSACDKCWGSGNKHKPWRSWKIMEEQLAASQARCREMEREIETLTTCGCEGCDDNLEESAFCFPCMNKVQQQVTQLQATLAAREERIRELEDQMNAKRYVTNEAL